MNPTVRGIALAIVLLLGGCASAPRLVGDRTGREAVDLDSVPFYPQTTHHCGPAALAAVLGASGVVVEPEALSREVYVPGLEGSLQVELAASARHHGRMAYPIRPTLAALFTEIDAGRPILILQNFGSARAPAWHYAVVVGYERNGGRILLRTGTTRRQAMAVARFDATWSRADRWGMVVTEPGRPPAGAELPAWLMAAGELAGTAGAGVAESAYEAAVRRWPDASTAWLSLGNAHLATGNFDRAETAYAAAVSIRPADAAARNNLALLLARRGCVDAATAEIARAADDARGTPFEVEVADSARQIAASRSREPANCPAVHATQ